MRKSATSYQGIGGPRGDRRLNAARFAVVFLLGLALGLNFFPSLTWRARVSETPEAEAVLAAPRNGIGGTYFEGGDLASFGEYLAMLGEAGAAEAAEDVQRPRLLLYETHRVQSGDLIGSLAISYGLNEDTILSVNDIRNSRLLQIGQVLRIPNQNGIMTAVLEDDTLETIAERYRADAEAIQIANQLFSGAALPGSTLFVPGGRLTWEERQEINGDLFVWPVAGRITSGFGWRRDPFGSARREFHNGIDIAARMGTPIRAALGGRVSAVGFDSVLGNFVIITHPRGYRTLYAHMSRVVVSHGAAVGSGQRIGYVGNTGRSTGPHLHFSVFRHGTTVNPRTVLR